LVGYIIQPSRPGAVIGIAYGPGGNGKTKLVQTIAKLLCDDAVYSGEVGRLESSPFGVGGLVGKLLFIDDDVKAGTKLPDGVLKKISEGKKLTGERKHKDQFDFINRAVPIMLCNNIPSVADLSQGLQRRLLVFKFARSFQGSEEDTSLFPKIWATELPGILNRALKGWQSFVANGHKFSTSKDMIASRNDLLVQANPLAAYLDECCELGSKYSMRGDELYRRYTAWCDASGYKFGVVKNTLTRQVKLLKPSVTTKDIQGNVWLAGIRLLDTSTKSDGH
jgi:P4 family phage/plasmid primase-like protien